jgi:hypothetical protein
MQLGFCFNTGARQIEKPSLEVCNPDLGNVAGSARTKHSVTISAVTAITSGSNSVVECQLPKLDVAGSIPVSRSTPLFP